MSTPNPPRDDPGQPQHGPQSQGYSYPNLTTPIPPAYPVYPTYPYPYPAPPPKTNWWAVVSFVGADEVEVGDCIAEIPQGARVETVETVDCRQPHAGEVYAQLAVPDADFPGEDAIVEKYASRCEPELASYSPAAAQDMSISLVYLHPTEETWERGDRAVHCIAVTLPPRSGSIKG